MAGADASAYLSAVKWGDEVYYVREFVHKMKLPQVAKIIKGQFAHLGVPTLASPSLNQIVFLSSGGSRIKVAAQCVKFKEGRKVIPIGPKLAIPDNYQGWFEILSEDGRAVRGIESVAELAKRNPESCVVRDPVKALVSKTEDPDAVAEKSRTLQPGETLILVGEAPGTAVKGKNASGRYLRCLTSKNETVYLNLESKGRFSPVAGEENISGVHTIRNLLSKRLPLMVRLVSGKPLSGSQFLPEMRLYSLFEEDCVLALPLLKDAQIVPLPSNVPLKLLAPKNADVLVKLREYGRLNDKCQCLISGVSDQIRVFDISVSKELRNEVPRDCRAPILGGGRRFSHTPRPRKFPHIRLIQRSLSDPQGTGASIVPVLKPIAPRITPEATPETTVVASSLKEVGPKDVLAPDDTRYDEIDQIYDYVRGFAPLPAKINSDFAVEGPVSRQSSSESTPATAPASPLVSPVVSPVDKSPRCSPPITPPVLNGRSPSLKSSALIGDVKEAKPEPPPIETIPARKLSTTETVPPTLVATGNCARKAASVSVSLSSNKNARRVTKKEVAKEINAKVNNSESEHIYEKLGSKREEDARNNNLPTSPAKLLAESKSTSRTDSANKKFPSQRPRTIPVQVGPPSLPLISATTTVSSNSNCNSKKLFVKSPPQQRTPHKSRFFKHFKGNNNSTPKEPATVHQIHQQTNQRCYHSPRQNGTDGHISPVKSYLASNSSKSLGSSPLFNIRYKSLSNLAADFDTLDSSNSGGQTTSSGSAGSKEHRPKEPKILKRSRLPRPRSLTNLLWDISQVDSRNRYNLSKNGANREFIFPPNVADTKYGSQTKAIGTLYL